MIIKVHYDYQHFLQLNENTKQSVKLALLKTTVCLSVSDNPVQYHNSTRWYSHSPAISFYHSLALVVNFLWPSMQLIPSCYSTTSLAIFFVQGRTRKNILYYISINASHKVSLDVRLDRSHYFYWSHHIKLDGKIMWHPITNNIQTFLLSSTRNSSILLPLKY